MKGARIYRRVLTAVAVVFVGALQAHAESVVLQLKWKHQFQFAGFYMALEKGFYRDLGLDVDIRELDENTRMFEQLSEGSGYYAIADTGALLEHSKGAPIKALGAIFQYSPLALMVKANSSIRTFSDLKGKRIMMVPNLNTGIALALSRAGLTSQDFEHQENSYNLQDLFDGKTDAFSVYATNQPYKLDELGIPYRLLYPKDEGIEFYGDIIITSENEISQHSSRVKGFLQASFAGWSYALEHIDETIDVIMDKYNPEVVSQHMLMLEAEKTKEAILSDVVQVGYMSERRWKNIAKIYAEQGMLDENYAVTDFIYKPQQQLFDFTEQSKWQFLLLLLSVVIVMLVAHMVRLRQVVAKNIEKVRKSEAKFKALFEGNQCVELVIDPETGAIIEANNAAVLYYGYSRKTLLSMNIIEINMLPKEEVRQKLKNTKENGIKKPFAFKHKLSNGSIRRVEAYAELIDWGDQKVIYTVIIDVTQRWEANRLAYKFRQSMEYAGQAVAITDKDGVTEYVNPAYVALTGFSHEECMGRTPSIFASENQDMWDTVKSGKPWHERIRKKKKNGDTYLAMVTFSLIKNSSGAVVNTVILQMDLSEYERLEQQLQQAQKMEAIGTLVGGIAHDFNNMLAGMVGNLYLAKKEVDGQSKALEKLNNIEQLSYKASDMINQLLTFARKGHIETKLMCMKEFLEETMMLSNAAIPESIEVTYSVPNHHMCVDGDATQLHQVLMNLISNAQDALEGIENPMINIHLSEFKPDKEFLDKTPYFEDKTYARLCVQDNGQGIPKEVMNVLFEPFFTTKEQGKGTGLGLSMVFGAIKTHHGYVEVESEEGKGTIFCVYLPVVEDEPCLESTLGAQKSAQGTGETLLLVDDEKHINQTNKEVLESLGYNVLLASNGLDAVSVFTEYQDDIDLVLIDVVMPKLGGIEAVARIQKIKPHVKVIYSTGYDNTSTLLKKGSLSDESVLRKPYRIVDLAELIQEKFS